MQSVSVRERFRPARIAFVIPHGDAAAFELCVRMNTALLGGMFNPILCHSVERQDEATQMLRAFDPDLIHHSLQSPLTWVPPELLRQFPRHYSTLFHTGNNGVKYFLYSDIVPMISHMWREIARIEKTTPFFFPVIGAGSPHHLLFKTLFGAFPEDFSVSYERLFRNNLNPHHLTLTDSHPLPTSDPWDKVSPIRLTVTDLHQYSRGPLHPSRIVFAGDPLDLDSLIDFWNLRAAGNEVLFVALSHFADFEPPVKDLYKEIDPQAEWKYLPLFFSRHAHDDTKGAVVQWLKRLLPSSEWTATAECLCESYWKGPTNRINKYHYYQESESLAPFVDGKLQYQTAFPHWLCPPQRTLEEKRLYVEPSFVGLYRAHDFLVDFPRDPGIEGSLRRWFAGNARVTDGGIAIQRDPSHRDMHIQFPNAHDAIAAIFAHRKLGIKLSEPGHVAKQILVRLGGIGGCRIFKVKAVRETIELLNDGKAHSLQEVLKTIGSHLPQGPRDLYVESAKPIGSYKAPEILELMHRMGMVQQGWRLQCNTCSMWEWYPIADLRGRFVCRWCFADNATPQLVGNPNVTFAYRANGLYLSHQKVKGSIPVILSLWRLTQDGGVFEKSVFTTSIEVWEVQTQQSAVGELDYVVLIPHPLGSSDYKLVLGEARGQVDYRDDDIKKVRHVADRFGREFVTKHVALTFSTLKDAFADSEKALLRALSQDGYEVIPLTRLDLDPYDLHDRFEGLPNQYSHTLEHLGTNLRTLNL